MKVQLDSETKVIKVEGAPKFAELVDFLEKILPNGEWKEYSIETNTVINNWGNPYIIEKYYPYNYQPYWYYHPYPTITCSSKTAQGISTTRATITNFQVG